MTSVLIPEPRLDEAAEREVSRLIEKGAAANRWRSDFDAWFEKRLWAERYQSRLLATLERDALGGRPLGGLRVLDLGSGRGGLSVVMALAGARIIALDLRRRNCRVLALRAGRYGLAVPTVRAVGEDLPFGAESFDLVVCKDVIEHCRDPHRLLGEISRVLASGGCAYVTFINRLAWMDPHYRMRGIHFLPRALAEFLIRREGREKQSIRDRQRLSDMHHFTLRGVRAAVRRAGLLHRDLYLEALGGRRAGALRRAALRWLSLGPSTLEAVLSKR